MLAPGALRQGCQVRNSDNRLAAGKSQALYHAGSNAHASESARAATKHQRIHVAKSNAALQHQLLQHRQNTLCMLTWNNLAAIDHFTLMQQGC